MRVLNKHFEDPLTKPKLPIKLLRIITLEVKRCVTSNKKKVISKDYQIVRFILIHLVVINNGLEGIVCQFKTSKVRNFSLMNKLANIPMLLHLVWEPE